MVTQSHSERNDKWFWTTRSMARRLLIRRERCSNFTLIEITLFKWSCSTCLVFTFFSTSIGLSAMKNSRSFCRLVMFFWWPMCSFSDRDLLSLKEAERKSRHVSGLQGTLRHCFGSNQSSTLVNRSTSANRSTNTFEFGKFSEIM